MTRGKGKPVKVCVQRGRTVGRENAEQNNKRKLSVEKEILASKKQAVEREEICVRGNMADHRPVDSERGEIKASTQRVNPLHNHDIVTDGSTTTDSNPTCTNTCTSAQRSAGDTQTLLDAIHGIERSLGGRIVGGRIDLWSTMKLLIYANSWMRS